MQVKKIVTPSDKEKKENRNRLIIGIVLVGVMLLSTAGFALFSGEKETTAGQINYNGQIFYKVNDGYMTNIGSNSFYFTHSPYETEGINMPFLLSLDRYYNQPVFIASSNRQAIAEIAVNLGKYTTRLQEACLDEKDCKEDLPLKNCNDTIIAIKEANLTKIYTDNKCVFIEAKEDEQLKAIDAFLYKILSIR